MAKLEFLKISNYKSILDFECRLGQGVNVFTGPSDSGKSNIIRCIRDFFFNAKGDDVITAKKTRCTVSVNDCIWEKSKGVNRYLTPDGTYENVGRTSPQQLRDHFKIDEIAWDDTRSSKLQFIQQHDSKFFLDQSYTGSLNAKILGLISGIQRTYNGNKLVLTDIKDAKYRRETLEGNCKQAEEELKKYTDLPRKAKLLSAIKKAMADLEDLKTQYDNLSSIASRYSSDKAKLDTLEQQKLERIDSTDLSRMQEIASEVRQLTVLAKAISNAEGELEKASTISIDKIETDDLDRMREIATELKQIYDITGFISESKNHYSSERNILGGLENLKEEREQELRDAVESMDLCPLTKDEFCTGCREKICH